MREEITSFRGPSSVSDRRPSKERFLTALWGGQPDYVPLFDFLLSQRLFEEMLGYRPERYEVTGVMDLTSKLGLDAAWIPYGGYKRYSAQIEKWLSDDTYVDEWGTTYRCSSVTWTSAGPMAYPTGAAPIAYLIQSRDDLRKFEFPDPTLPSRLDDVRLALELAQDRVAVLGGISGPFEVGLSLAGWEAFMVAFYEDPQFVIELLKIGAEYYGEACRRMIDAGVDAICIAEDLGSSTSTFASPDLYRRLLFPVLGELIQQIKNRGVPVLLHCDGNINAVVDDLVDLGIDGYHPVERKAQMDIFALKAKYGNRLCLVGNVDSTDTLWCGTPEQVRAEVLELLERVAPGGAYVLASDSDLRNDMPSDNVFALIETGKQYGRYPLWS